MDKAEEWAKLPYFLAVARSGSLRAAAEGVGGTHATVNRNLKALEAAYGVRLFDRSKSGLALTSAGDALMPLAEEAEAAIIAARRRVQGLDREASGTVRLSVPTPLANQILAPILARFAVAHPEIDLAVTVTNRFADIARSETDVSVRVGFQVDDDVVGRKVLTYAMGVYASQTYLDREFHRAGPDGEGLCWVGWGEGAAVPDWVKTSPFPRARVRHAIREGTLVAAAVQAGMGMSYLPVYVEAVMPGMVRVPGTEVRLDRSIWLLLHSDLRRTTRVRLLVDHLASALKDLRGMFLGPLA